VGNQEIELQKNGAWTWTPVQHLYRSYSLATYMHTKVFVGRGISPTSEMRVEIQTLQGFRFLSKVRQANEAIDLQGLFHDFWDSTAYEFVLPSQS